MEEAVWACWVGGYAVAAPGVVVAAQGDVPVFRDGGELKVLDGGDAVVHGGVVVPLVAFCVDEDAVGGGRGC